MEANRIEEKIYKYGADILASEGMQKEKTFVQQRIFRLTHFMMDLQQQMVSHISAMCLHELSRI